MIKRKNDLHELIASLSTAEKRHFRLFSGLFKREHNDYQLLYDAIEAQEVYDESEILKKFKGKKFVAHLDIKKHYLYQLILKALSNFHSKDFEEELTLSQVDLLQSKGLYRQALTLLEREKRKAREAEKLQELVSYLEKELSYSRFYNERRKEEILDEMIHYSQNYNLQLQFRRLHLAYREKIDQYMFVRSEKQQVYYDNILSNSLLKKKEIPQDFRSAYIYCLLRFWNYGTKGDWKNSFEFAQESFELVNHKKNKIQNFFQEYMFVYNNLLVSAIKSFQYSIYEKYRKEICVLSEQIKSPHKKAQVLFVIEVMNLIFLNNSGKWELSQPMIKSAEDFIRLHINNIDELRAKSFYFNLAKVYIGIKDFKSAYRWLNKIIGMDAKSESHDFHAFSRLIFCLCCFERNDPDLMLYTLRSTKKYMSQKKIIFEFEKRFIKFLEKEAIEVLTSTPKEGKLIFETLKKDISEILRDPNEKNVLNYFWFDRWIESKIN
jgi:hypothetical protein